METSGRIDRWLDWWDNSGTAVGMWVLIIVPTLFSLAPIWI
jgi:hypothetical protein